MLSSRPVRRILLAVILYAAFCTVAGIFIADGTLHPVRRPLTNADTAAMRQTANSLNANLEEISLTAPDGATLSAWMIHPHLSNHNAVILLHGLGDNRVGMSGYARLLLEQGFTVLMPDARAHGASGGTLATFGLLERNDIHQWFDLLTTQARPHCIYALGESMGAAQLLQSLEAGTHFCAVAAESPFANFREIAYDRMGQPFHLGPWFGRTILRPVVEVAFLRAQCRYGLNMSHISPQDSVATTTVPVVLIHGQIDSNIPIRHSREIHAHNPRTVLWEVPGADHCGALSTAPEEFKRKLLAWFQQKEN